MKKLGAILFGIVFILGLSIEAGVAQQVETVDLAGVAFHMVWDQVAQEVDDTPVDILNDWGAVNRDESYIRTYDLGEALTLDFKNPTGAGPYTAVKVKLWAKSGDAWAPDMLSFGIDVDGEEIGYDQVVTLNGEFQEYSYEWTGLNMDATDVADLLRVQIAVTDFRDYWVGISAVQVELVSEDTDPIPVVTDPIPVKIDYRPYRNANPLNYRSHGKVLVVIFGSADLNVRQIDRESVLLAGVAPVRDRIWKIYSRTDRARDDYEDLVLNFRTQQLIEALELALGRELENGEEVFLNLTGNLKDDGATPTGNLEDDGATPIEGQDTAVVFGKHPKHKKKGNWKNYWKRHRREKD